MRLALLSLLAVTSCRTAAPPDAPNILLISVDTLRADHLPSYGYARDTAPLISRVAAQGTQLDGARSQAPSTELTHASLFTGRFVADHGVLGYGEKLSLTEYTLAEHFSRYGYRTFAVATSVKFAKSAGFTQGFEQYERVEGDKNTRSGRAVARVLAELAREDDRPYFGFLHLFDPHAPYAAPEPYRSRWGDAPAALVPEETAEYIQKNRNHPGRVPAAMRAGLVGLYDGQIAFLDAQLAPLWAALDGVDTVVVLTSDHGEAFHEHGLLGHTDYLYEELLSIPLIFWGPGRIAEGAHMETPVQSIDLFPTLAELAGLPRREGLPGRSFAAALTGGPRPEAGPDEILSQSAKYWSIARNVQSSRFKLTIRLSDGQETLCDLGTDPRCDRDVLGEHPRVRDALRLALAAHRFQTPARAAQPRQDIPEEDMQELRALGYVE